MRLSTPLYLAFIGASAWAAPGLEKKSSNCKKGVCNADNCLRAVRASSAKPYPSSATADCSSFLQKTVTPCAATSTTTTTVTVTTQPVTLTATAVVDKTDVITIPQTVTTVVTTIIDTVTFIQPTEVDVVNIIVSATTVTGVVPDKRAVETPPLPTVPGQIQARVIVTSASATSASTCAATTNAPTSVPTYASACSGTVRYSSACSCAGVTASTTTLSQTTVTATATATATYTPTSTLIQTATSEVSIFTTQTAFVPTTFETTAATVIVESAFTLTTDVVIPTTVIVSPPVCSTYQFAVVDGSRAGQFIGAGDPSTSGISYGFTTFTSAGGAHAWTLRPDGKVYSSSNTFGWVTRNNNLYYVLEMTDSSEAAYQLNYLHCSISKGGTSFPDAVGLLTCTTDAGTPTHLVSCTNLGNYVLQAPDVVAAGSSCSAFTIAAIPAC